MHGKLSRHLDADDIQWPGIDAKPGDVDQMAEFAKQPVGDEFRRLRGKDDTVENDVLEYEGEDRHRKDGHQSPDDVPPENLEVFEEGHFVLIFLRHGPSGSHDNFRGPADRGSFRKIS